MFVFAFKLSGDFSLIDSKKLFQQQQKKGFQIDKKVTIYSKRVRDILEIKNQINYAKHIPNTFQFILRIHTHFANIQL